jgi:hypothetical protein
MNRWQYVDPPAPEEPSRLYGRDQVLGAERWAWAGSGSSRGHRAEFFYDGFEFWRQLRSGERRVVSRLDVPATGWWHKPDCNCHLCRAEVRGGSRELAGAAARW